MRETASAIFLMRPLLPCPYRRADEMNGLDTCFFQGQFKTEIEFGRIDTDENVRPLRKQMIPEMVVDTLDFTIVRQNLEQAVDGKLFHRPVADEIVFRHLWATDAVHQCIGQLGTSADSRLAPSKSPDVSPATMAIDLKTPLPICDNDGNDLRPIT